jgi:opacity protein-like surface antigen
VRYPILLTALLFPAAVSAQHHHHRHHREAPAVAPTTAPTPVPAVPPTDTAPAAESVAPPPPPAPIAEPPPAPIAAPPPPADVPPVAASATTTARPFALEFGPVLGLDVSTNALGLGPDLGLEFGGRLALGRGVFAFALRGAWQHYAMTQSSAAPCAPTGSGGSNAANAPSAPCVSMPSSGAYDYTLGEDVVRLSLLLSYRFLPASSAFNAYVGVAPQLALQRAETTAWNLLTTETATRFGVGGLAGAQYRLGPGSVWLEAGYAWVPVGHRVTGDASISTVTLALGYRVSL